MTVDGRAVLLRSVTEDQWLAQVLKWARRAGWRTYHTHNSRRSTAGFPDVVCVRPPRLLIVELKKERGVFSQAQRDWLADLLLVPGIEVHAWRPRDEASVKAVLGVAA